MTVLENRLMMFQIAGRSDMLGSDGAGSSSGGGGC